MRAHYDLSPEADSDLGDIADAIADRDVDAARRYINGLFDRFQLLAEFPHLGRARDEAPALHSFAHNHHMIFYRRIDGGVEIARVLHGARDLAAIFRGPDA